MRVLSLAANPSDGTRLAVGEEHREIDARIRAAGCHASFELTYAHEVRARELGTVLQFHKPSIVHFGGHGSELGELIHFSNTARSAARVDRTSHLRDIAQTAGRGLDDEGR